MNGAQFKSGAAGLVALLLLTAVCAEALGRLISPDLRIQIYAGGAGGIVISAVGFAVALKLTRLGRGASDAAFWKWWGGGMLVRMFLLLGLALILAVLFEGRPAAALLALAGVYLVGMFGEAFWLSKQLLKNGSSGHG